MASLYIKDTEANDLADELAGRRGLTKTAAVKMALRRELERDAPKSAASPSPSAREITEQFWRERGGLPPPTGLKADKAFYDELSGEL